MDQRDGEWVKVGGMITESKKIRTRSGSTMMFATLDDLEGSVEIVVFEKALAAAEGVIADDAIVIVRGTRGPQGGRQGLRDRPGRRQVRPVGRRDREGQGAGGARSPRAARSALKRRVDAAQLPATVIDDLRELFERYPGETEFVLEMHTRTGLRRLKFGAGYRVQAATRAEGRARRPAASAAARRRGCLAGDAAPPSASSVAPRPLTRARADALAARASPRARRSTPTPCRPARPPCRCGPGPRRSRQALEARLREERDQPSTPISPSPRLTWRSRLEPSAVIESLTCSAQPVAADDLVELVDHLAERLARADVVARGEQVAGVQADAEALLAAGELDQRGELLERAPERPARAGGVLEQQRARLGLRERLLDDRRRRA